MEFIKKHLKLFIGVIVLVIIIGIGFFLYNKSRDNYLRITGFTYFQNSLNIYTVRDDILIPKDGKISLDGVELTREEFYKKLTNTQYLIKQDGDKFYAKEEVVSEDRNHSEVDYKSKRVESIKVGDEYTLKLPDFKMKSKVLSINKEFTEFKLSNSKISGWDNYDLKIGSTVKLNAKGDVLGFIHSICDAIEGEVE